MYEEIQARCRALARRAGLGGLPPVAVGAAVVLLGVVVVFALWRWWPRGESTIALAPPPGVETATAGAGAEKAAEGTSATGSVAGAMGTSTGGMVCVHLVGAVIHPGVYELAAGKRVADAVEAAGGISGNGAAEGLNLARVLTDGEQIVVPTQDEYARAAASAGGVSGSGAAGGVSGSGAASGVSGGGPSAGKAGAPPPSALVNINTADAAALDTLPGVGPSTAAKIVADREANGAFASPDDLGRVAGIGPKKLEQLKACICVR